ncbi:MAG TPA: hypothetical protein VNO24_10695 [Blastocatellia bacterium]|nr:hypothetical protein [Blastocatellia bacterium]
MLLSLWPGTQKSGPRFEISIGAMIKVDPYTATIIFLTTPLGQRMGGILLDLDVQFVKKLLELFNHMHGATLKSDPSAAVAIPLASPPDATK